MILEYFSFVNEINIYIYKCCIEGNKLTLTDIKCTFVPIYLDLISRNSYWKYDLIRNIKFFLTASRCSRVSRGSLVYWHSATHFLLNSRGILCWLPELNAALCLDTRAKKCGIEPITCRVYSPCTKLNNIF